MKSGNNAFHIALIIFLLWAAFFIFRTSAIGLDGNRYWVLFDDGMISMRYALNLVNGFGLTWNPGEYVEGFTNPLWTLIMATAIAMFGKFNAPLVIQLIGLLLVVSSVILTKKCADKLLGQNSRWSNIAWLLVLTYYPLMYWSLGGMEVSALAFCMGFVLYMAICQPSQPHAISLVYGTLCTAYLIRPDGFIALIPALAILHLNSSEDARTLWIRHSQGIFLFLSTISLLALWRHSYYGEWLPNTYTLKVTGYDLAHRFENGTIFVGKFIISTIILWIFLCYAIYRRDKNLGCIPICLGSMPVISCAYQLYVGGDPWLYWRQLAPGMIPLVLVAVLGFRSIFEKFTLPQFKKTSTLIVLTLLIWISLNGAFRREVFGKLYAFDLGDHLVKMSNLLNDVMVDGQILVFWAGTLPYYYNGYAIDALGKTDKYIASLPPDYSVAANGMKGLPGHAKHSMAYSMQKNPDFLQLLSFFGDDYSRIAEESYVAIEYKGKIACVKNSSTHIRWELVQRVGSCLSHENDLL